MTSHPMCMYVYVALAATLLPTSKGHLYRRCLSAAFRVRRAIHAPVLLCRRSCFGCPLTGPKPVSEHQFRYPNTRYLATYSRQGLAVTLLIVVCSAAALVLYGAR